VREVERNQVREVEVKLNLEEKVQKRCQRSRRSFKKKGD